MRFPNIPSHVSDDRLGKLTSRGLASVLEKFNLITKSTYRYNTPRHELDISPSRSGRIAFAQGTHLCLDNKGAMSTSTSGQRDRHARVLLHCSVPLRSLQQNAWVHGRCHHASSSSSTSIGALHNPPSSTYSSLISILVVPATPQPTLPL